MAKEPTKEIFWIFISPPPAIDFAASGKAGLFGHCTPWSFADVAGNFRGRNRIFRKTTGVHQIKKKHGLLPQLFSTQC